MKKIKKGILIPILAVVCALCGTVTFAACDLFGSGDSAKPPEGQQPETPPNADGEGDGADEDKPHVHEYKLVIEKPTATAPGQATDKYACGDIEGTVVLPVLTDSRYIKSADTATCTKAGTVTCKITLNKVEYRFNIATPATGAHKYSEGVCECGAVDPNYEPHEHSYTAKSDESGHWTECACGAKTAVKGHSYTYASDNDYHWQVCSVGKETTDKVGHSYADGKCVCGKADPHVHSYTAKSDESGHWTECACGAKTAVTPHSFAYASDNDYHWQVCSVGKETTDKVEHNCAAGNCVCGKEKPANELAYRLSDDGTEYYVVGIGTVTSKSLVIPASYRGLPVTQIGNYAFKGSDITSVTIPASVTEINSAVFISCYDLQNIIFEDTACDWQIVGPFLNVGTAEGQRPLPNSKYSISSILVSMPNHVGPYNAFDGTMLADSAFMADILAKPFKSMCENKLDFHVIGDDIVLYNGPGGKYSDDEVFTAVVNGEEYPATLEMVIRKTDNATVGGVKKVSGSAFYGCEELVTAEIADGVEIGLNGSLFKFCEKLESVKLPSDMKIIPQSMFESCYALQQINLPKGLTHIDNMAFRDSGLTSIVIPASVVRIGAFAFEYCYDLKSLRSISFEDTAENWQIRPHVNTFGFLQDDPVVTGKWYTFIVNHHDGKNEWLYNPEEAAKTLSNLAYAFLENDLSVDLEVFDSNKDERKFYGGVDILDNGSFFVETDEKSLEFALSFSIIKPDVDDRNACGWHSGEFGNAIGVA